MRSLILAAVLAVTLPVAAQAQQLIGSYYATLGPNDLYNSSGTRLSDFGAILQQDRANVHRFGIYDALDQGDPYFGNRNVRSQIPSIWRYGSGGQSIPANLAAGYQQDIYVEIYGYGSTVQYIVVSQAAG